MSNTSKILVYIPSRRRSRLFFECGTYRWLKHCDVDYIVTLEQEDVDDYLKHEPNLKHIVLPKSNKGTSYAHSVAKKYAEEYGYDIIFKHDDDIRTWASEKRTRSIEDTPNQFKRVLRECTALFDYYKSLDGISFPYENEMRTVSLITGVNTRFQTCYMVRTEKWHIDTRIMAEDFFASAMILKNGGKIIRYGRAGVATTDNGKNIGVNEGGLQDFNRRELALRDLEVFKEKGIFKGYKEKSTPPYIEPII